MKLRVKLNSISTHLYSEKNQEILLDCHDWCSKFSYTPLKTKVALEKRIFQYNPSSNGGCSIVILVFKGYLESRERYYFVKLWLDVWSTLIESISRHLVYSYSVASLMLSSKATSESHRIHVWHIYLHLVDVYDW